MIEIKQGNLLTAPAEALVNTVNTEGVMGKGIALQFKQAFPQMFRSYERACKSGEVKLGKIHVFDLGGLVGGPRWILNFPTKGHWRSASRIGDVEAGLEDLVEVVRSLNIRSIAVPPLGCGNGGLDWNKVRPLIEAAFDALPDVHVLLYAPGDIPQASAMPNCTERPQITVGQASLLLLMDRYLKGLLDPFISLLELHKLMYFLQEAGQPLRLDYQANTYGPYAHNLRHVLIRLESHYTQGYGDGRDDPAKPIELLPNAVNEAENFLKNHPEIVERVDRVVRLMAGYEDAYGLELLSSVHWVMRHNPMASRTAEAALADVQKWNARKRKLFKPEHIRKSWQRLKDYGWDASPAA